MKRAVMVFFTCSVFFMVNAKALNSPTMAEQLKVENAWARATFSLATSGAAYMSLVNTGDDTLHLLNVEIDSGRAMTAELHHTVVEDGMMRMQQLTDGVHIASNTTVLFAPSGKHIMLMGLSGPLISGQSLEILLKFEDGSNKRVTFVVKDARSN